MPDLIGDAEMQGTEPSNVIYAAFTPKVVDGGKGRLQRHGRMRMVIGDPKVDRADDLLMDHVDTASCGYVAPDTDCA